MAMRGSCSRHYPWRQKRAEMIPKYPDATEPWAWGTQGVADSATRLHYHIRLVHRHRIKPFAQVRKRDRFHPAH
jgi:hypothetical protein